MVFFSWSKNVSKQYALLMKDFLEKVFLTDRLVWFSETSIESGRDFFESVSAGMNECDSIVLFLTRENLYNPWIQFEFGHFYNRENNKVWPLYFDGEPDRNSTVFEHIQLLKVNERNFVSLINDIFHFYREDISISWETVQNRFTSCWEEFRERMTNVKQQYLVREDVDFHNFMLYLGDNFMSSGREASVFRFKRGFETAGLYRFILSNTKRRLWVFGRKNKKMFDRSNIEFFLRYAKKPSNAFSLRCLFMDPSEENKNLNNAQKKRHFADSLKMCIEDAVEIIEETGLSVNDSIHLYRILRNDAIIISDNIVYFTNVRYSEDLKPEHLTDSVFFATSADSCVGEYYLDLFTDVWDNKSFLLGDANG